MLLSFYKYIFIYSDNNLRRLSCVCADYMTERGICSRGGSGSGLTAMQKACEGVYTVCVERGGICRDEGGLETE